MTEPFLTLLDHTTQWVFNKTFLSKPAETNHDAGRPSEEQGATVEGGRQYLQLVISASYDLIPRSRQEIIELCRRELAEVLPPTREAQLRKATVIKEVNATFSPEPGSDRWRPGQRIPLANLYLCGDWTRTGWPATMEGAVRSGYLAAEAVLVDRGTPRTFLQPYLPVRGAEQILGRPREWYAYMKMGVAICAAGVFYTEDGGRSWQPRNRGTRADFLPDRHPEIRQCVHELPPVADRKRLYQQYYCDEHRELFFPRMARFGAHDLVTFPHLIVQPVRAVKMGGEFFGAA